MMPVGHLSRKGYLLIPKPLRKRLGFKPGGRVHVAEEGGRLVLTAVPDDPIAAATGALAGNFSLTADLLDEHRTEARRERKARTR